MRAIQSAWAYRAFIWASVRTDLKSKYANSAIGGLWIILHPLANAAVLALVLSQLIGSRLSGIESEYAYAIYLLSGIVGWTFFAETSLASLTMFRDRSNLLKKVNFPKICVPLIVALTGLLQHLIFTIVVVAIVWSLGLVPTKALALLPIAVLLNAMMAIGFGLFLSIFDAFNRDVSNVWIIITQFWFWLTPVVYSETILPVEVRSLIIYNPMYWVIDLYHQAIAFQSLDVNIFLAIPAGLGFTLIIVGGLLFLRAIPDMVDNL